MKRTLCTAFFLFTLMIADLSIATDDKTAAPPEALALNRLIGEWDAEVTSRNRDGSWPEETSRAIWRWYEILDGEAIQDDWIKVTDGGPGKEPILEASGTNIRIYNAEEEQWHMAWIDRNNRRVATFTATNEDDSVVMTGLNAKGRQVRITFSKISKKTFEWQQEWTMDEGTTWFPVARMTCTRRK